MSALTDREILDLLHERADLLALADAVAATQPRRRRVSRRALATALAAAAALVVALVAPWQSHGPNVTDRALAAVGSGPILHAVVEYSWPRDVVVNIETGAQRLRVHRTEYWYDDQHRKLHTRYLVDGALLEDVVETPGRVYSNLGEFPTGGAVPQLGPAIGGFATGYREALENGSATPIGTTTVNGREAKLLQFHSRGSVLTDVAVDAESGKPLRFRFTYPGGRRSPEWRVSTIESLPRDDAFFAPPELGPLRPTVGFASEGRAIPLDRAAGMLGATPLWLGQEFAGQRVESVTLSDIGTELSDGRKLKAVVVRIEYEHGARVSQSADAFALGGAEGPLPPPGSIVAVNDPPWHWQGYLRVGRLDVVLDTASRERLLEAARALKPLS